ncbi:RNA-directed DNA polymerase, eukaryota, reverse transcriptase zinc-binding domain protein, partial [Tanacetum coccineum]
MLHGRNILPINTLSRKVGNGSSIRFWKDPWNGNGILMTKFNMLYHLDANADCFLSYRRVNNSWVWDWKRQVLGSCNEATLEDLVSVLGQCNFLTSLMHGLGFLTTTMLPTRLNLSLRGLDIPSIMCPMCNNAVKSVDHVFFGCDLSSNVWCL